MLPAYHTTISLTTVFAVLRNTRSADSIVRLVSSLGLERKTISDSLGMRGKKDGALGRIGDSRGGNFY